MYPSMYLSNYLPIYLSIHLSIHLFICLSVYLYYPPTYNYILLVVFPPSIITLLSLNISHTWQEQGAEPVPEALDISWSTCSILPCLEAKIIYLISREVYIFHLKIQAFMINAWCWWNEARNKSFHTIGKAPNPFRS